jgi:hypothetical protein
MFSSFIRNVVLVTIFAIALAMLESAVVIYLRELYYPSGFTVAFTKMPGSIILTELCRELATIVMLVTLCIITGSSRLSRFAWFLFSFAVWDIFYYVWLKVFIHWPAGLFDWDILFLFPVTWLGPVLAPVICSICMIFFSLLILYRERKVSEFRIKRVSWILIFTGALIIYFTFTVDYTFILFKHGFYKNYFSILDNPEFIKIASTYIPTSFSWVWFSTGIILILTGIEITWISCFRTKSR